ncbi:unannotated protein [freshwater metagenome]|uniref:Unannotated protein n=1 Tax=freshwater metagenome TaxID=449393 RepID=A0A6J6RN85_9ZZZZ
MEPGNIRGTGSRQHSVGHTTEIIEGGASDIAAAVNRAGTGEQLIGLAEAVVVGGRRRELRVAHTRTGRHARRGHTERVAGLVEHALELPVTGKQIDAESARDRDLGGEWPVVRAVSGDGGGVLLPRLPRRFRSHHSAAERDRGRVIRPRRQPVGGGRRAQGAGGASPASHGPVQRVVAGVDRVACRVDSAGDVAIAVVAELAGTRVGVAARDGAAGEIADGAGRVQAVIGDDSGQPTCFVVAADRVRGLVEVVGVGRDRRAVTDDTLRGRRGGAVVGGDLDRATASVDAGRHPGTDLGFGDRLRAPIFDAVRDQCGGTVLAGRRQRPVQDVIDRGVGTQRDRGGQVRPRCQTQRSARCR